MYIFKNGYGRMAITEKHPKYQKKLFVLITGVVWLSVFPSSCDLCIVLLSTF